MVKEYRQKKVRKIMNTTLLIMAAGIGSRFGPGIKQLEPDVPGARPRQKLHQRERVAERWLS